MTDTKTDTMPAIAACRRCGRGWVAYRDYDRPCGLVNRYGEPCKGKVEPLPAPVENHGQSFPEWITGEVK